MDADEAAHLPESSFLSRCRMTSWFSHAEQTKGGGGGEDIQTPLHRLPGKIIASCRLAALLPALSSTVPPSPQKGILIWEGGTS